MNADQERILDLNLDFLEEGASYTATIYRDGDTADWENNPYELVIETKTFTKGDVFHIRLASGGGFGAILVRD